MRTQLHPACILHRRPFRETSLLLEVFSSAFGRLGLVARGARRQRSRQTAALEPFQFFEMAWSGRGELGTLTAAEPSGPPLHLSGQQLASGFYLNELLMRLLPRHDPCEALFRQYVHTLRGLGAGGDTEPLLRIFEKRLLETLGYAPILDHDIITQEPLEADKEYFYVPDRGPSASSAETALPVTGATLLDLARESLERPTSRRQAKQLMRMLLSPHLGDKPLASRALLRRPA